MCQFRCFFGDPQLVRSVTCYADVACGGEAGVSSTDDDDIEFYICGLDIGERLDGTDARNTRTQAISLGPREAICRGHDSELRVNMKVQ